MTVKYVAEITHVQEVSLLGAADLAFWKDHLARTNLGPTPKEGKSQLRISAMNSKFRGIRFLELIIAVYVRHAASVAEVNGVYLIHAFNSSRLFAFLERTCFSTPYYHGRIGVEVRLPASIELTKGHDLVLRASMSSGSLGSSRVASSSQDESWEGPVYLPHGTGRNDDQGKLFFAKIAGHTQTYPFDFSMDQLTIRPTKAHPVMQWLIDSNFTAKEWNIRENAAHGKSKTIARSKAGAASGR